MSIKPRNGGNLGAQITQLERQIGEVERAGPGLAELEARTLGELEEARTHFAQYGFSKLGVVPAKRERFDRLAVIGALMTIAGDKLLAHERKRLHDGFSGGLSPQERNSRLHELHGQLRALHARRELAWREQEQSRGELVERDANADPASFLAVAEELHAIAEGKEA